MMHSIISIFLICISSISSPDPKAKNLMDKVYNFYEKAGSLDISFTYEQANSDIAGLLKKGQLIAKGDKFKLSLEELDIYSDGKTQYTFLKKNKEVQITEPDTKETKYHPKQIAAIYKSGTHLYSISKKIKEANKSFTIIEFQPIDKMDPISKINLFIDEKTSQLEKVQWSEKKGNKTNVNFTKRQFNKIIPDSSFVLDTKSLKGIHVEDLRD